MSNSKVSLVTGVSSVIGGTTAEKLSGLGCRVFGAVRNLGRAKATSGVTLIEMYARDEASIALGIETPFVQTNRIDVLVSSAGVPC